MMIGNDLPSSLIARARDKRMSLLLNGDNVTEIVSLFPYPSELPFNVDTQKSPIFELFCIYQAWSIGMFGFYFVNCDFIITGIMVHLAAQFRILNNSLRNVVERAEMMTYGVSK